MFNRISQVHVFILYSLSLLNKETNLSFATKRVFEKMISLQHTPIELNEFHDPNFETYKYIGETKATALNIIKKYGPDNLANHLDTTRKRVRTILAELETNHKIINLGEGKYRINLEKRFEEVRNEN